MDKELKKEKRKLKEVEKEIEQFEKKKSVIEVELAEPTIYNNIKLLEEKTANFDKITQSIEKLHENWENILLSIESFEEKIKSFE